MVSQQLVEQWRARLAEWQQRLDEGRPRPWLARAYVRVFSFLLAQYGHGDDAASPVATDGASEPKGTQKQSTMCFEAVAGELAGKPPRSRDDIRSVLEAVKAKVPHVAQGPLADGLHPDDPIVIAAFYHPLLASGLKVLLERQGIATQLKRFRRQTQVVIRAGDLEGAKPIVASHAASARDSSRLRLQFADVWSTRGVRIGLYVALITAVAGSGAMMLANPEIHGGPLVCAVFAIFYVSILVCVLIGWLIGLLLGQVADD